MGTCCHRDSIAILRTGQFLGTALCPQQCTWQEEEALETALALEPGWELAALAMAWERAQVLAMERAQDWEMEQSHPDTK
jgi:hypothetical protein